MLFRSAGKEIEDQTDMLRTVAGTPPGQKVEVVVMRQGKEKTLTVQLAEKPKTEEKAESDE